MRWPHTLADDFFTKQLPNNVTWLLTLMYSLSQTGAALNALPPTRYSTFRCSDMGGVPRGQRGGVELPSAV